MNVKPLSALLVSGMLALHSPAAAIRGEHGGFDKKFSDDQGGPDKKTKKKKGKKKKTDNQKKSDDQGGPDKKDVLNDNS